MAIGGYHSVAHSLAPILARNNIELAYRLAPGNAWITARLAMSLSGSNATPDARERADALARQALRRDATVVTAVATLGVNAEILGDKARARRLFAYAQTLSRRHFPTQVWAIENAVGNGDVQGALRHYDIALRTAPRNADLLFPVLAAASADRPIRDALIRTLAGKPSWGDAFISHLAEKGPDPQAAAELLLGLRRAGIEESGMARMTLVNALAAGGYADNAWSYYASDRRDADRRRSRDPRFTAAIEAPSQLDWVPVESPGISASIRQESQAGGFEYSAPAGIGGPLLRQLQLLPPGSYRLTGHGSGIDQPDGERPYWLLTCHDGREFGRVEMPRSTQASGGFAGSITVPPGCGIQMLQMIARPASAAAGLSGLIDRVQLEPAR